MLKRIILVSSIVIAGVYLSINYNFSSNDTEDALAQLEDNEHTPVLPNEVQKVRQDKVLSTGIDTFKPKTKSKESPDSISNAVKDTIVWQESDKGQQVLTQAGLIPADVTDEAYIELDREELLSVEVGEYLDLYIPQFGGSYTGEVDHIQTHPNGDRTVEAHIPGAGTLYAAVITVGENATYGNLATPRDVFILEGNDQYAWIAPKSAMMKNHIEREPTQQQHATPDNSNTDDVFDLHDTESPVGN